jgi:hypothetical protein
MSYITPVTDRTQVDIVAQNSKAYFNIVDWQRIYNNARLMIDVCNVIGNESLGWDIITEPTMNTIPSVTDFNTLLENIELARQAVNLAATPSAIKYDWGAGIEKRSPKFTDVNLWEIVIDAIWNHFNGGSISICPTLSSDLTVTTGNNAIYIDCLDCANFNVDLQGTANLYII